MDSKSYRLSFRPLPLPPLYAYSITHRYTKGEVVRFPAEPLSGDMALRAGHN